MSAAAISLSMLIVAIVIGFVRKVNVGIICIAFAFALGSMLGISAGNIIKGFNANLFITLMGVTFLFSILNTNGTIEIVARKIVNIAGGHNFMIPLAIYLVGLTITTIGPGAIPALAIMPAFAIPIAVVRGYNPIMLALIGCFGIFSGRMSTITPEGVLVYELLGKAGVDTTNAVLPMYANMVITGLTLFAIAFVYYKGYKVKNISDKETAANLKFNKKQLVSFIGLLTMVVAVVFFKQNVGLFSFGVGAVLLCLGLADEGKALRGIPWGVLILVAGVGTLMELVIKTDGIKLMTSGLVSIMNSYTAAAVMGATGGIMSWFSSGLGVVFPTLIPTVAGVAQAVGGGVNPIELCSMVVVGGTVTGVSPFSTTGALIVATAMAEEGKYDQNKLFIELFAWSVVALIVLVVLALLGVYKIFL